MGKDTAGPASVTWPNRHSLGFRGSAGGAMYDTCSGGLREARFPVATLVAVKEPEGAQIRFLDAMLRVSFVARQPARQVVGCVEVR